MSTPLSTPVRHAKLGISSTRSLPLTNEYKKLLNEQHQRLWVKHQQDLDLIDDIRSYVKARLSIERDYSSALNKLSKQHASHIAKKFVLSQQCDPLTSTSVPSSTSRHDAGNDENNNQNDLTTDSRFQKRLANNGLDEPDKPCSLYKVWSEHINRLQLTSKNRADQFEQLVMIADKLKDIRSHKASIGKKCLDTHLKRIHEDILVSMVDIEKTRKLYYEDESQAKKARENEEKIKKKRSGLLTKFTDLQAKKEKTSAQREANDIQSTQARNDYIMALAAGNAHLQHYYHRDLNDFIHLIDDGVLDHCKIFMATLSECDINSLKDALYHAQYWSKMINLTGSQKTNSIYLECEQSICLRKCSNLAFESCNNDPIQSISLEHNADYALQHEIDKWFTWFKKECRNLSQLMHQLDMCQHAFAEGKKGIELNGQTVEDLEPKIIDLKQQIRKSEAAKLKAQARLKVIKEGGMQIEEWSTVESEIRADMARAQEELEARVSKEVVNDESSNEDQRNAANIDQQTKQAANYMFHNQAEQVHLQVSRDSDDSEAGESVNNLASVSRSNSNLVQKQQHAMSGYSALTDPSLVWQDDYSSAWGSTQGNQNIVVTDTYNTEVGKSPTASKSDEPEQNRSYDLLGTSSIPTSGQKNQTTSMTVQSSSPLSAIVDGVQSSPSPYPGMVSEAYKSDYECDYNRTGHQARSAASSAEPYNQTLQHNTAHVDPFGVPLNESDGHRTGFDHDSEFDERFEDTHGALDMLNKKVVALYAFDKTNEDDLAFNENDILRVVEVSDANWVKARNEATGEEGFIPTSYIRLHDDAGAEVTEPVSNASIGNTMEPPTHATSSSDYTTNNIGSQARTNIHSDHDGTQDVCDSYCRAVYDYEPELNTFEDDGLPHLALVQGELMRIIDQGEDDGWWLVEKEQSGTRGHVPSMLVEEVEPGAEEEEDEDDGDVTEESNDSGMNESVKAMPSFEPPVLGETLTQVNDTVQDVSEISESKENEESKKATSSSLIPTSFIIIEPTPEVESKSVGDSSGMEYEQANSDMINDSVNDRKVVQASTNNPPTDVSYSVINEDFVLEKPQRRPEVPADNENSAISDGNSLKEQNQDLSSKTPDGNYEPLSEVDSVDIPAPPSVVIESCFDKRDKSFESDEDIDDEKNGFNEMDQAPAYVPPREIKHTGNVDVSPILRHRAEEFSKQIIAEALMMAPGTELGPSTSSSSDYQQ